MLRRLSKRRYQTSNRIAPKQFVKQLKSLRASLQVVWNARNERWEIWDAPSGDTPYMVTTINACEGHQELTAKVLLDLQRSMSFTPSQILDYITKAEENRVNARERKIQDTISQITKNTEGFVHGVPVVQVPRKYIIERATRCQ